MSEPQRGEMFVARGASPGYASEHMLEPLGLWLAANPEVISVTMLADARCPDVKAEVPWALTGTGTNRTFVYKKLNHDNTQSRRLRPNKRRNRVGNGEVICK